MKSKILPTGQLCFVASALLVTLPLTPKAGAANSPVTAGAAKSKVVPLPPLKYTQFRLKNGLRVIFHEDHSTPVVTVNVWYHVGSKNEVPGRTGFAHLFEHLMFQGSKHHDDDFFKPLQEAGGSLNGTTNSDRTNYFETVPANFLELALWLESDRMGYLLDSLTETKLNNQREVVKNEKRQNYDNQPYGQVGAKISEIMYPPSHPYHWLTIGSLDDVTGASMGEVKDFFHRYYTPNNASLVISGDFKPSQARRWVDKYFGPLKSGAPVASLNIAQPKLDHEIRETMEDRVSLPRLYAEWHAVPQFSKDDAALDMLSFVLAGGKGSRLYKSLVYDRQIAQDVSAYNASRELAGEFAVVATARPGKTLAELESAINEEIAKIKAATPTADEMERAYNTIESSFIYGLQTVGGKADQLNSYATFLNNPGYAEQDLERYRRVTPADVMRVANEFLTDKKLVLSVVPLSDNTPKTNPPSAIKPLQTPAAAATAAQPTEKAAPVEAKTGGLYDAPKPQAASSLKLPQIQRRRLSNGLEVLVVEHHELPVVSMDLVVKSGATDDPSKRTGLATMTADMLDEGTQTRSSLEIANQMSSIGAQIGVGAGWDSSSATLTTLTRHLDESLDLFSDVVLHPSFPTADFERLRARRLASLRQKRDNASAIANDVYANILYGADHPYGHAMSGDEASTQALQIADVQRFYETYYRPNNSTLIVVGDVKADTILPTLERAFGTWKGADVAKTKISTPEARTQSTLYLVDKPGAAQSVITVGQIGVSRDNPDYFPLRVMNTILGGQFMSRLNMNLREDKGYTYGARTSFEMRLGAGPFSASAGVQTAVTKEAVIETLKELRGIRGAIPITPQEVEFAKQYIIRAYPAGFETPGQIAGRLEDVVVYGLPDNYFNTVVEKVNAVTLADVSRVANKYLDPSKMAVLIVGDRQTIEPSLRSLENIGTTLTVLDDQGNPFKTSSTP